MAYTPIDKSNDYFTPYLWTGDGTSPRNITGVGFQPDLVWGKCRNSAVSHAIYDSVRGASNLLSSNSTSAEGINPALNAFISDGFTVNSDSYLNLNANTYVGWNWLAGGTASTNTDGSIDSQVSVNTTAGFSIVSYTAPSGINTIGHGLGVTPNIIIVKVRDEVSSWIWGQDKLGWSNRLLLNATNATGSEPRFFYANSQEPNATTWSADQNAYGNANAPMIAYCFAEKKGYSKFGSYTGNGSADGTFVYTGFKPAFVLMKGTNVNGWLIIDNKRTAYNSDSKFLYPQASDAEEALSGRFDFTSNGFKLRNSWTAFNSSGQTYIYMAFAENPFVTSGGTPTTAR